MLRGGADYLARHGIDGAQAEAETLLMSVLRCDRARLYSSSDRLTADQARTFGRALCQRCEGTPIQHLTGSQVFRELELGVRPGVFIPRPETEVVVERALARLESDGAVALDIGTGTGAIALSLKSASPTTVVHAVDLSRTALELASENAQHLGLDVVFHLGDMYEGLQDVLRGGIDLIVSNPPYVTSEEYLDLPAEVLADPIEALVGGPEVYRRLVEGATGWLRPGGWLVVEIGASQGGEVSAIFSEFLTEVTVAPDLAGRDRIVEGRR